MANETITRRVMSETKCTPELTKKFCDLVESGYWLHHAAAECGVHHDSIREWNQRGRTGEEPYASFAIACAKARGAAERAELAKAEAAQADGKSAALQMWKLERMNPKVFRLSQKAEITGEGGGPVQLVNAGEQVRQALDGLRKRLGEGE